MNRFVLMLNILFIFVIIGVVVYFQLNDYEQEQQRQISNIEAF